MCSVLRNGSSCEGDMSAWFSKTMCRPTTATSSLLKARAMRCACGSEWRSEPGQSIWKATTTTTLPLSFFRLSGSELNHCEATSSGGCSGLNWVAAMGDLSGAGCGLACKRHSAFDRPTQGGPGARCYRQRDLGSESSGANGIGVMQVKRASILQPGSSGSGPVL